MHRPGCVEASVSSPCMTHPSFRWYDHENSCILRHPFFSLRHTFFPKCLKNDPVCPGRPICWPGRTRSPPLGVTRGAARIGHSQSESRSANSFRITSACMRLCSVISGSIFFPFLGVRCTPSCSISCVVDVDFNSLFPVAPRIPCLWLCLHSCFSGRFIRLF